MTAELPPSPEPAYRQEASSLVGDNVALIALVAFVLGVLLNGYIALSVLDSRADGGSAASQDAPLIVPAAPTAEPTATQTPLPDRTDCDAIRGTQYRSATEREFFLVNCINLPEPTPTIDPTQLPPLDGGTNTEAVETPAPTPEP